MENKFDLTVEENIFVAKKYIVDYIWRSAKLEGINVTYPQTYAIVNMATVNEMYVADIIKILNLKHAWYEIFAAINEPLDLAYICKINADVARDGAVAWGKLRTGKVRISGTNYVPPVPDENTVNDILESIKSIENETERAITLMFKLMKAQLFWDGNKRTSMLAANKLMIQNGCGIISVPNELLGEFNEILCNYYTNDTLEQAKAFVYENCIDGIDFRLQEKIEKEKQAAKEDEDNDESKMQGPSMTL